MAAKKIVKSKALTNDEKIEKGKKEAAKAKKRQREKDQQIKKGTK
jgi:hypothetical protein